MDTEDQQTLIISYKGVSIGDPGPNPPQIPRRDHWKSQSLPRVPESPPRSLLELHGTPRAALPKLIQLIINCRRTHGPFQSAATATITYEQPCAEGAAHPSGDSQRTAGAEGKCICTFREQNYCFNKLPVLISECFLPSHSPQPPSPSCGSPSPGQVWHTRSCRPLFPNREGWSTGGVSSIHLSSVC